MITNFGRSQRRILIFGAGKQGLLLSKLLISFGHRVSVADKIKPNSLKETGYVYLDFEDICKEYRSMIAAYVKKSFDLTVCCLPGRYGYECQKFCAEYGIDLIDMSFGPNNPSDFNSLAQINHCTIIPDVGLAPGLPSIMLGKWISELEAGEKLEPVEICVGGVSREPNLNQMGYLETFSIEDLYHEYTRPARFIEEGKIKEIIEPVTNFSKCIKTHSFSEIGLHTEMESIPTDGVRTMLDFSSVAPNVIERTLRWPGHYQNVFKILNKVNYDVAPFVSEFREHLNYASINNYDQVVFHMSSGNKLFAFSVCGNDENTAMSITTAGAVCALINTITGIQTTRLDIVPNGVTKLEVLGSDNFIYANFLRSYVGILRKFGNDLSIILPNNKQEEQNER